ncbi:MAG: hypothetical protein LUE98_07580, partial [Tannerellaceae bacterium]|nr:hypothetical protein [Tannerellaceae bacterium]
NKIGRILNTHKSMQPIYKKIFKEVEIAIDNHLFDRNDIEFFNEMIRESELQGVDVPENLIEIPIDLIEQTLNIQYIIKDTWQQLLYKDVFDIKENYDVTLINSFLDEVIYNYDPVELTLAEGIAGLGIRLIKSQP